MLYNTLFLVHVEEMFRERFPEMFIQRICKAMYNYDQVYVFCSEINRTHPVREVRDHSTVYYHIQWAWGYEPYLLSPNKSALGDMYNAHLERENGWIIPSNGHEFTLVPEELRDSTRWEDHKISLGGGCRSECLQDMVDILDYQKMNYRLVDGLIYD